MNLLGLIYSRLRRDRRKRTIVQHTETNPSKVPEDVLPGELKVSQVVKAVKHQWANRRELKKDYSSGIAVALNEIPDGMACGLLAGVNPVMGLFAAILGCITGSMFTSTKLMIVTTTSAASFLLYELTRQYPPGQRVEAIILIVLLSGCFMVLMGMLKMGNMVRFVSHSVMTGFLAGISVLAILSQLPLLTGISVEASNKIVESANLLMNIRQVNFHALLPGLATILCMVLLPGTILRRLSAIVAIVVPSVLVYFLNWNDVEIVSDVGEIPQGLPDLHVPDLSLLQPQLFMGAFSLAIVTLIQAAGVSQSVPNPDGSVTNTSRDFVSQGIANVASGLVGGIGVGGSLGSTSLNIISGARSRWSGVFAGWLVLALVLLLPGLVGKVAMPGLAGLMIFAMAATLKFGDAGNVWRAGWAARVPLLSAFLITLVVSIELAILSGVLLSFAVYFFTSSRSVKLQPLKLLADGRFEETDFPAILGSNEVHIFSIEGDLHFAGARVLEKKWPAPSQSSRPVIVLMMSGRHNIGATVAEVLGNYYSRVRKAGGRLYLTELDDIDLESLRARAVTVKLKGIRLFRKRRILGESTREAAKEAGEWLRSDQADPILD